MLDFERYFTVGDKIHIEYLDGRGHLNKYISQVADICCNEYMDIVMPIHRKQNVYLKQDSVLNVIVSKEDAIYKFVAVLHEKIFGKIPLLRLKALSDINKIQRRDFYRLKIIKDIEVRIIVDLDKKEYDKECICSLIDISAGGLLFNSQREYKEKDTLEFKLNLNGKIIIASGTIVRRTLNDNFRAPYSYGVKFVNMSKHEVEAITKFIYEEQRRLIKKGLI